MLATTHIVSPTASPNLPESKSTSSSGTSTTTSVITQQTTSSGQQGSESHSLEHEKKAICRHPLFPLMALLFEKCERATQTPDCPAGDNFDVDIQAFVQHQEKDRNPFFSDDTELDSLMLKAIQVLRIHLLELEKVNELCKDFCHRYITCLKSKMQSEHLLRTEVHSPTPNFDGSMSSSSGSNSGNVTPSLSTSSSQLTPTTTGPSSAPGTTGITTTTSSSSSGGGGGGGGGGSRSSTSNHHHHSTSTTSTTTTTTTNNNSLAAAAAAAVSLQGQLQMQQQVVASMAANNVLIQQGLAAAAAQPAALSMGSLGQGQIVSGGTVYQMVQTPQGIVAQPIQIRTASLPNQVASGSPLIHGSTPLSQIGVVGTPNIIGQIPVTSAPPTPASTQITPMGNLAQLGSDDEDMICKRKTKRGILPKTATKIMRSWLFQNIVHPYPSEDEKRQIAAQTNLTLLQVNNWFINARRRILQPMLDASNPDQAKVKKNKPPNRPLQRFWPENIANLRPQIPTTLDGNLSGSSSPLSIGDADGIGDGASNESSPLATSSQPSNQTIVLPNMETATFVLNDGHIVNASASLDKFRLDHIAGHTSLETSRKHPGSFTIATSMLPPS
ncbi:homeobox protein PKNOX1-like isoform X2 [Octopus sinensis]|uniref:Homeobox protein PKNOX1-like isoform X2 n=1 Tax=Octopus sinensis TaxID=2607531 RepID=A0A7E6FGV7_9MOLL|nr:homeobox protein PKNOX1-like isoform X2 [Octopus sinensis]